jgi:gas vesicle protein
VAGDLSERAQGVAGSVQGVAVSGRDAVSNAPALARQKTQGNPLVAGLVAFGAGLLISSLIPASSKEKELAGDVKAKAEPLKSGITDAAKDVAANLREPAQEAVQAVKETATDAVSNVKDEGASAASDVKDQAQQAKTTVQDEGASAASDVKGQAQQAKGNVQDAAKS